MLNTQLQLYWGVKLQIKYPTLTQQLKNYTKKDKPIKKAFVFDEEDLEALWSSEADEFLSGTILDCFSFSFSYFLSRQMAHHCLLFFDLFLWWPSIRGSQRNCVGSSVLPCWLRRREGVLYQSQDSHPPSRRRLLPYPW